MFTRGDIISSLPDSMHSSNLVFNPVLALWLHTEPMNCCHSRVDSELKCFVNDSTSSDCMGHLDPLPNIRVEKRKYGIRCTSRELKNRS